MESTTNTTHFVGMPCNITHAPPTTTTNNANLTCSTIHLHAYCADPKRRCTIGLIRNTAGTCSEQKGHVLSSVLFVSYRCPSSQHGFKSDVIIFYYIRYQPFIYKPQITKKMPRARDLPVQPALLLVFFSETIMNLARVN